LTAKPVLAALLLIAVAHPSTAASIEITEADAKLEIVFHGVKVETLAKSSLSLFIGVDDASWQMIFARPNPSTVARPLSSVFVGTADAARVLELRGPSTDAEPR
jgi:hypothetical protein